MYKDNEQKNNGFCLHCHESLKEQNDLLFCSSLCHIAYNYITKADLLTYYEIGQLTKHKPTAFFDKNPLENSLFQHLITYQTNTYYTVILRIKNLTDSSDVYLLERLSHINSQIISSSVEIRSKIIEVNLNTSFLIYNLLTLLSELGYVADTSYHAQNKRDSPLKPLITQLGIAGFCFGNVMMLSLPEYFDTGELWLKENVNLFRIFNLLLTTIAIFSAAQGYFKSALTAISKGTINMDVPISLGISVIYLRSIYDVISGLGSGYFDSVCGLIFFLLLGKYAQNKVYTNLQYDRDYKDYFPIAVTKIVNQQYVNTALSDLIPGDHVLIHNNEIIPADATTTKNAIYVDYSFITGESLPVLIRAGEKVLAGAKLVGSNATITLISSVNQSYLTKLWNNTAIKKENILSDTSKVLAKYFTTSVLIIALFAFVFWMVRDSSKAFHVLTSILVIACPCALALSIPFTYGFGTHILSNYQCYLAHPNIIEYMSQIDTLIFDKTGTLTSNNTTQVRYQGLPLTPNQVEELSNIVSSSNHPLSKIIAKKIPSSGSEKQINQFEELVGHGIIATIRETTYKIGSASFLNQPKCKQTATHLAINGQYYGKYIFYTEFRTGIQAMFKKLKDLYHVHILSGDNEGAKEELNQYLDHYTQIHFNQSPHSKLSYIQLIQEQGHKVAMLGDGLNDSGALKQSHVGISVTEDTNNFSPACDVILLGNRLKYLPIYLEFSKCCVKIVKQAWFISLTYNIIGITLAVMGLVSPLFSAILMPISSISVLVFTHLSTTRLENKLLIPINNS